MTPFSEAGNMGGGRVGGAGDGVIGSGLAMLSPPGGKD